MLGRAIAIRVYCNWHDLFGRARRGRHCSVYFILYDDFYGGTRACPIRFACEFLTLCRNLVRKQSLPFPANCETCQLRYYAIRVYCNWDMKCLAGPEKAAIVPYIYRGRWFQWRDRRLSHSLAKSSNFFVVTLQSDKWRQIMTVSEFWKDRTCLIGALKAPVQTTQKGGLRSPSWWAMAKSKSRACYCDDSYFPQLADEFLTEQVMWRLNIVPDSVCLLVFVAGVRLAVAVSTSFLPLLGVACLIRSSQDVGHGVSYFVLGQKTNVDMFSDDLHTTAPFCLLRRESPYPHTPVHYPLVCSQEDHGPHPVVPIFLYEAVQRMHRSRSSCAHNGWAKSPCSGPQFCRLSPSSWPDIWSHRRQFCKLHGRSLRCIDRSACKSIRRRNLCLLWSSFIIMLELALVSQTLSWCFLCFNHSILHQDFYQT